MTKLIQTNQAETVKNIFFDCFGWFSGYSNTIAIIQDYEKSRTSLKKEEIKKEYKEIFSKYDCVNSFIEKTDFKDVKTLKKQMKDVLKMFNVSDFIQKEELKRLNGLVF